MEVIAAEPRPVSLLGDTHVSILDTLMERNEMRTQLVLNNSFFLLWRDGGLDDGRARRAMLECLTLLAATFGTLPSAGRTCDQTEDVRGRYDAVATGDPILRAISTCYHHQVPTLDDAGKMVFGLVLETTGYYLGILAGLALGGVDARNDFDTPAEREARQREVWRRCIQAGDHPNMYSHLHTVLDDAWDMLDEATTRIATLVSSDTR